MNVVPAALPPFADDSQERLQRLSDIASRMLEQARASGASQADVTCNEDAGLAVNVRMGEVETVEATRDRGISVTVYFGQRKGSASTADLREDSLESTVEQACAIARHTEDDTAAGLAELQRPPFDMPVADSELVFGHLTEYTGLRFAFFLLTEYAGIVSQSAIAATLFLGGWKGPFLDGPWWLAAKVLALSFVVIWARSTYPRLREDQLQSFAWLRLVPVSLALLLVVGFLKVYEVGI